MANPQRDPRTAAFLLVGGLAVAGTIARSRRPITG